MMAGAPRLSVVIPFYNETAFLPMAVRSVMAQGISGLQGIIVNDNPASFGPDYFASLALPAQFQVIHHAQNSGLSAARNSGMAEATGKVIGFLDADDYYLADGLARQLDLAEHSRADITHAQCCISHVGSPELRVHPRDAILYPAPHQGAGLAGFEAAQFFTSSWSSLYRRAFLTDGRLTFDEAQTKFEDRLFVLSTVTAAKKITTLGRPTRVWRRRAGSISVTPPDAYIHRLQVQLLEKCMLVMQSHAATKGTPPRFLRRELFNTLSRLIWDMDIVTALATGTDPTLADLGPRLQSVLAGDSFGHPIFDDPVLSQISRVGQKTRKGLIRRVDFFQLHKVLRDGDFPAAAQILQDRADAKPLRAGPVSGSGPRVVLHLGMHKTGSTFLQKTLRQNAAFLRRNKVLFPDSGLAGPEFSAARADGFPGHFALLTALRKGEREVWSSLAAEVKSSRCDTVILSCENMLLPMDTDRTALISALFDRLSWASRVDVVAFVRRPDHWAEMFYRELVCNGHRFGARSIDEFLVDYGATLTDLPGLFAPFEACSGGPVRLVDHDASAKLGEHWRQFREAAGLSETLPTTLPLQSQPVYPTPGPDQVLAAQMICTMISQADMRTAVTRAFFSALGPDTGRKGYLLSPQQRLGLLDRFATTSAMFGAERGYAPDLDHLRAELGGEPWSPPTHVPRDLMDRVQQARLQCERLLPPITAVVQDREPEKPKEPGAQSEITQPLHQPSVQRSPGEITLRIRARPWLLKLLGK